MTPAAVVRRTFTVSLRRLHQAPDLQQLLLHLMPLQVSVLHVNTIAITSSKA
jgi:hypothetical protein